MNLYITLTLAGTDTGPFNLYSDITEFLVAFESGVTRAELMTGYSTANAPAGTTIVRIKSVNKLCNNFIDVDSTNLEYYFEPRSGAYTVDFIDNGNSAFVYGYFNGYYNGNNLVPGNHLVKVNSDRTYDTSFDIDQGFNEHIVYSGATLFKTANNKLILSGFFTSFNGVTANRIIRLNPDGSRDNTFDVGTGFNNYTTSIIEDSLGSLFVTGIFNAYKGVSAQKLVKISNNGVRDASFDVGVGFNNSVISSLINPDDTFYVSGYFTSYKGITTATGIVKLNPDSTVDASFDAGIGFNVGVLKPTFLLRIGLETSFYVFGHFTTYKGINEAYGIKLNSDGTKDTSFNIGTGFNGPIGFSKIIWANKILCQTSATDYNGTPVLGYIILNADGTIYHSFAISYGTVYAIGNNLYGTKIGFPAQTQLILTYTP